MKGKSIHLTASGPDGQRIYKKVVANDGSGDVKETWYVRDAQGNVMGIYEEKNSTLYIQEHHLYGSSRLGIEQPWDETEVTEISISTDSTRYNRYLGNKFYELSNHLGNVLVTVTDQKQAHNNSGNVDYWEATVASYSDYYPFGMMMPGRYGNGGGYRFGFNGKEKDNETKGVGVLYDYGFRIYDSRLARFLSVDPLFLSYPFYTPYQFAGNNPVMFIDLDGLERKKPRRQKNQLKCPNWKRKHRKKRKLGGGINININLSGIFGEKEDKQEQHGPTNDNHTEVEKLESIVINEIPAPELDLPSLGLEDNPMLTLLPGEEPAFNDSDAGIAEFRGEHVNEVFSFSETLGFNRSSDIMQDRSAAKDKLHDLADFLKNHPNHSVYVAGNLQTTDLPVGHGQDVLNAQRCINGDCDNTAGGLMGRRAMRTRDLLIEMGVDPSQVIPGPGNNYHDDRGRSSSFEIRPPR